MSSGPVAYVALGGNLGDPVATLRSAVVTLASVAVVESRSSLYDTAPVGGDPSQPRYLNAVVACRPLFPLTEPRALLASLRTIERLHGRVRRERWGPRTLDLDLLDLGGVVSDDPYVTLPHPRMMERSFVLAPLCEIAPEWRHPASGVSARAALERLGTAGVTRTEHSWRAG